MKVMLQAAFLSPEHLFIRTADDGTSNYTLNSYELAERLAFFLWASPARTRNWLRTPTPVTSRSRPCSARKSRAWWPIRRSKIFVTQFINGWLDYRLLPAEVRSTSLFPTFNTDGGNALFGYMSTETFHTAHRCLSERQADRHAAHPRITRGPTGRCATYYGLPAPTVDLPGFDNSPLDAATKRMGILSHGGLLTRAGRTARRTIASFIAARSS